MVVAVGIIVFAMWFLYFRSGSGSLSGGTTEPRFEGDATTPMGRAVQSAESVECRNNLAQLRQAITMDQTLEGSYPQALRADWNVALECPVSGQSYQYDPATGEVWCTTPGHEDY
jgi:hypothetical protein